MPSGHDDTWTGFSWLIVHRRRKIWTIRHKNKIEMNTFFIPIDQYFSFNVVTNSSTREHIMCYTVSETTIYSNLRLYSVVLKVQIVLIKIHSKPSYYVGTTLRYTSTSLRHQDSCRYPGAYLAPGHNQPPPGLHYGYVNDITLLVKFTNPRMHLLHIPQCSLQNRNAHISVLNGALWDMEQVHSGICEIDLLF